MAILSNEDIEKYIEEGKISINPYEKRNIQGATIDLRLNNKFLIPTNSDYYDCDGRRKIRTLKDKINYSLKESNEIVIKAHGFILGSTLERIALPNFLSGRVDGKSGVARNALIIEGAGHITPGFEGEITLEIYNQMDDPILLKYGDGICQLEFHELSSPSTKPYNGQYLGQKGPKV